MTRRHFSVESVNALLPGLRTAVEMVAEATVQLESLAPRLFGRGRPDSDTVVPPAYFAATLAVQRGLEAIQEMGGEVKDHRQGLVDFRSLKDGQEVYLCWVLGEEKVTFWHDLHAGFAGRTAITDQHEFHGDTVE